MSDALFTFSNNLYLPHLSASTVNSFIENKLGFLASKRDRAPFQGNEYTGRGTAVEHGINVWLETGDTNVVENALEKFDEEMEKNGIHKMQYEEVRESIPGLALLAFNTYVDMWGEDKPVTQHKITARLDGVQRDIVGYLDFHFVGRLTRDSKVVSQTPSKLKQAYILQGALYKHATGHDVVFDFFVANKKPVHKPIALSDDDFIFGLGYLTKAAQYVEELETCDCPKRMMDIMAFPNLEAMWSMGDKKAAAAKYGINLR